MLEDETIFYTDDETRFYVDISMMKQYFMLEDEIIFIFYVGR